MKQKRNVWACMAIVAAFAACTPKDVPVETGEFAPVLQVAFER